MRYCSSKKLDMGDLHWQSRLEYAFCLHKRGFRSPQSRFIPSPLSIATFHLPPDPHLLQHRKHLLYPFYLGEFFFFILPCLRQSKKSNYPYPLLTAQPCVTPPSTLPPIVIKFSGASALQKGLRKRIFIA